jgi:transposase InsO family protein
MHGGTTDAHHGSGRHSPGKKTITTVSNPKAPCPLDKVNREFRVARPNALWVVDFTYVHTWAGFVYVAFVIDAYARRIVGWKVSTSATAGFVLDALEQAIHARRPGPDDGLVHHSDRGVQYLAMAYTQRLAEANLVPSVGSVGDSYDNALAETINGLYKAEVIWRQRSWPAHQPSKWPPCDGWTGTTINASLAPSATFRLPKPKPITMQPLRTSIWLHDSMSLPPENPGRFKVLASERSRHAL